MKEDKRLIKNDYNDDNGDINNDKNGDNDKDNLVQQIFDDLQERFLISVFKPEEEIKEMIRKLNCDRFLDRNNNVKYNIF